jgi:predicted amidohydrolase
VARDSYFAIADEAKKQGLPLVGHIPMTVTPEEASDQGQLIEHTETLFEGTFSAGLKEGELPGAIRRFRSEGAEALFARFVRNHTPVSPTLVAWGHLVTHPDPLADPRMRYVARVPGFFLHDELSALVDAGLTPLQALRAATSNAAAILHQEREAGSVAPGKLADLVLLDGNPLERIDNAQRIAAVVLGGKLLRRADLDGLLRLGEQMASRN